ncbi:MAG TPA: hypothetical protein PKE45_22305 [Caldilineaceae bacterium]|nr:hypothetical protein [Caldilineaceae bacterium]
MTKPIRKLFTTAEAKTIGDKLGIDWTKFTLKQFRLGINAELADGAYNPMTKFVSEDPILLGKIVRAHLNENPDYYTQWAQMEKAAKRDHIRKHKITQARATAVVT